MELFWALFGAAVGLLLDKKLLPRLKLRKMRYVLPLPNMEPNNSIYIRPSLQILFAGTPKKTKRAYTHSCEVTALNRLRDVLHGLPVSIRANYEDTRTTGNNWIVFGLNRNNPLVATMMREMQVREDLSFVLPEDESHFTYSTISGKASFKCEYDNDLVRKDYGVIYRKTTDTGNIWLLCGGLHMYGTQAALETALSDEFINKIRKERCVQFIQLVEVQVHESGIIIEPDTIKWKTLPLVCIERRPSVLELASRFARSVVASAQRSRGHSSG